MLAARNKKRLHLVIQDFEPGWDIYMERPGYEHVRFEVENCGGIWINESAVVDGNIVSAQTWQDHPAFFRGVMAHLKQPRVLANT